MSHSPVVVITGGASGIGRACAIQMASKGYNVAINYFEKFQPFREVIQQCLDQGVKAIAINGDVSKDEDCRKMVDSTIKEFSQIDAVISCAGVTQITQLDDLESQNAEDFQRIYAINVIGMYQIARASAPYLKKSSNGSIVNISSIASQIGSGSSLGYIASKGAVNSLTIALAKILAPEVRVNAVLPGLVNTDWFRQYVGDGSWKKIKKDYADTSALQSITEPEEIASSVAFLCVEATKTTGQLLYADAGSTLGPSVNYTGTER